MKEPLSPRSPSEWKKYYEEAPDAIKKELLLHFATRKRRWNMQEIKLSRKDISELICFQKGIAAAGVSEAEFRSVLET